MLHGHVCQEVGEIPAFAGRRPIEIGQPDGVDDVDRLQDGDSV
jgi:hypothetical protein